MLNIPYLFLFLGVSLLYSDGFETQTPDPILQERDSAFIKDKGQIKSKEFIQENSIYKADPLLETIQEKKVEEATLLEKILLQMHDKNENEQKEKIKKEVFKKPLNENNELITPDPLLDEI